MEIVMEEIIHDLHCIMIWCFVIGLASCLLIWINVPSKTKNKKRKSHFVKSDAERLHCFDCEIEMPVKVKNGRMYCSNCGLPH